MKTIREHIQRRRKFDTVKDKFHSNGCVTQNST